MQQKRRTSIVMASVASLALLAGCSSDDTSSPDEMGETPPDGQMVPDADTFSAGMSKTGEAGLEVMIMSADPAPPSVGYNTWELMVHDADGAMLMGATVTVEPFMPEHGHGSNLEPFVTEADGTYTVSDLNLMMAGVWRNTVTVEADGATDTVVFNFLVE